MLMKVILLNGTKLAKLLKVFELQSKDANSKSAEVFRKSAISAKMQTRPLKTIMMP